MFFPHSNLSVVLGHRNCSDSGKDISSVQVGISLHSTKDRQIGRRLGKQMPLFGMYQPHIAQDSPSKLLDASSAYKQCPREIEELCSTHCSQ